MPAKKHKLLARGLYAITPDGMESHSLYSTTEQILQGGVRLLQYRNKSSDYAAQLAQAKKLYALCKAYGVTFIINDHIKLAAECEADGIHLGQDDESIQLARRALGDNAIIGISCYGDIDLAKTAVSHGADYIAYGSFFNSITKPNAPKAKLSLIAETQSLLPHIPICGIGGITPENAKQLTDAKIDMIAMITSLYQSPQPKITAQHLAKLFV